MSTVIKVENLSKLYRLGQVGTGTMSNDLNLWWHRIRGKENPYIKIGEENDRTKKGNSDVIWALQDINFSVKDGEVLGIIGRNGAGKSTLLKILSRTTAPTTGAVKIRGRIASLLEVGTGFHPDLSGRQNVYLNGAILGMTRAEIKNRFDEIVDFAGVERYIDTPVKRYSSGMYVRLAFGVAAHLEPEILIIDEVLAVGDAEFQKKCLGKMKDVSINQGRTVLFVSHNMGAVKTLCKNVMVLERGKTQFSGTTEDAATYYMKGTKTFQNKKAYGNEYLNKYFTLHEISLNPIGKTSDEVLNEYQAIDIHTFLTIHQQADIIHLTYVLKDENGSPIFTFSHRNNHKKLKSGPNHLVCSFPEGFLNIGSYHLSLYLIKNAKDTVFVQDEILSFEILMGPRPSGAWMGREPGVIKPVFHWEIL